MCASAIAHLSGMCHLRKGLEMYRTSGKRLFPNSIYFGNNLYSPVSVKHAS